ncbi:MAG: hypothetical protein BJ554DRAFT_7140, partial [Olpidium bornovanus]
ARLRLLQVTGKAPVADTLRERAPAWEACKFGAGEIVYIGMLLHSLIRTFVSAGFVIPTTRLLQSAALKAHPRGSRVLVIVNPTLIFDAAQTVPVGCLLQCASGNPPSSPQEHGFPVYSSPSRVTSSRHAHRHVPDDAPALLGCVTSALVASFRRLFRTGGRGGWRRERGREKGGGRAHLGARLSAFTRRATHDSPPLRGGPKETPRSSLFPATCSVPVPQNFGGSASLAARTLPSKLLAEPRPLPECIITWTCRLRVNIPLRLLIPPTVLFASVASLLSSFPRCLDLRQIKGRVPFNQLVGLVVRCDRGGT